MLKTLQTARYRISVEETGKGGPSGYESTYLTSEGEAAGEELYALLEGLDGEFLVAKNKKIRQRNGRELVDALRNEERIGIASGFKPSGAYHFGHTLTSGAVSFFQKNGAQVFMPVADVECHMDTDLDREKYEYFAADNLVDWGANGINLDAAHVYLQSEEHRVSDLAYLLARGLTFDLAVDIYGFEKLCGDQEGEDEGKRKGEFPFLFAGITQVGDIVLPQHPAFGNYHSFMVSGQDQDGHMKMTSELIRRAVLEEREIPGLQTIPSAFYIPHMRGLVGKASSSKEESTIYLGSGPNILDLEERIKESINKIEKAEADESMGGNLQKCALDMVRYIPIFNEKSKIDFNEALNNLPPLIREVVKNGPEGTEKINLVDTSLMASCNKVGQDNVQIVKETLSEALHLHQEKRQDVIDYAIKRAEYKDPGAWAMDDDKPSQPDFWKVPEKAIVDESLRNDTQWFHMVASMKDKLVA